MKPLEPYLRLGLGLEPYLGLGGSVFRGRPPFRPLRLAASAFAGEVCRAARAAAHLGQTRRVSGCWAHVGCSCSMGGGLHAKNPAAVAAGFLSVGMVRPRNALPGARGRFYGVIGGCGSFYRFGPPQGRQLDDRIDAGGRSTKLVTGTTLQTREKGFCGRRADARRRSKIRSVRLSLPACRKALGEKCGNSSEPPCQATTRARITCCDVVDNAREKALAWIGGSLSGDGINAGFCQSRVPVLRNNRVRNGGRNGAANLGRVVLAGAILPAVGNVPGQSGAYPTHVVDVNAPSLGPPDEFASVGSVPVDPLAVGTVSSNGAAVVCGLELNSLVEKLNKAFPIRLHV